MVTETRTLTGGEQVAAPSDRSAPKLAYWHVWTDADGVSRQTRCELDHLVPLEMGGADSLDNIWPQCGQAPSGQNFKDIKDRVETFLAIQVLLGKKDVDTARSGIASDWTQFIDEEEKFCAANSCDIAKFRK